ncbi:MAG: helix-turn-helix transcriptional regulator, partial [Bacilli bacterium]|nr:helix-turn-helix transcriptional regulator [Bacilli bacterium]
MMQLNEYLEKTNMSVYALSKRSGVPYSTTLSICRGKADIEECRLSTLRALAKALDVSLLDLINGDLKPKTHTFINGKIDLDVSSLPSSLRTFIAELEEYDRQGDTVFFAAADTMFLLADRLLKEGSITEET